MRRSAATALARTRRLGAAAVGWWFGFGYFLLGPVLDRRGLPRRGRDVRLCCCRSPSRLLPAGLALFYAAAHGARRALLAPAVPRRVLVLALALSATEWLRGHVFTGFPWNVLGYALTYPLPLMQSAARARHLRPDAGRRRSSSPLPPVLWSEAPAGSPGRRARSRRAGRRPGAACRRWPLLGQVRLALAHADDGAGRQDPHRAAERAAAGEVAPGEPGAHLPRSPRRCRPPTPRARPDDLAGITHVVWPEAAMPFLPLDHPEARAAIGRAAAARTRF